MASGDTFLWRLSDAVGRKRAEGGPAWCRVGQEKERRGRGRGAAPCETARHGRSGSGLFGQRQEVGEAAWRDADTRARQHSATRFGFKPI
jgi:hypothetical protein